MSIRELFATPLRSASLRRALFQVHLWSGIGLSLYIIVICITGSAIVFRRELDEALCPTVLTVDVQTRRLTTAELKAKARVDYPRFQLSEIEVLPTRAPDAPVKISLTREGTRRERLFNPYTGENLAPAVACEPRFVTVLATFHADLGGGRAGLRANGLAAAAVILICLSGAIVWWPGTKHWWRGMTVRRNVAWHRLLRDLHSALGFWLIAFVLVWALTGIYFAFPEPFNSLSDMFVHIGVSSTTVDEAIAWAVRLHFGRAFGYAAEILWAIFGLLPAVLVVTGLLTWWHRVRLRAHRV